MAGNLQKVNYELTRSSIAVSGEVQVGTITAPATHDLRILYYESVLLNETQTSQPNITHRIRRCSTAGTGTTATGSKVNPMAATTIASSAKRAITVDATAVSGDAAQFTAVVAFSSPAFLEFPRNPNADHALQPVILHGESAAFSIERNTATTTTPNALVIVVVEEVPI